MDVGFVWDDTKYKAVVKKHNVAFYEVVAAFDDLVGYEVPGSVGHEDRWLWVGKPPLGSVVDRCLHRTGFASLPNYHCV